MSPTTASREPRAPAGLRLLGQEWLAQWAGLYSCVWRTGRLFSNRRLLVPERAPRAGASDGTRARAALARERPPLASSTASGTKAAASSGGDRRAASGDDRANEPTTHLRKGAKCGVTGSASLRGRGARASRASSLGSQSAPLSGSLASHPRPAGRASGRAGAAGTAVLGDPVKERQPTGVFPDLSPKCSISFNYVLATNPSTISSTVPLSPVEITDIFIS